MPQPRRTRATGRRARPVASLLAIAICLACAGDARSRPGDDPVRQVRRGLAGVIAYMDATPELFPTRAPDHHRVLSQGERDEVLRAWAAFDQGIAALDALGAERQAVWAAGGMRAGEDLQRLRAAFLAQYRFALEFLARTEHDPTLDVVLNEAAPGSGLPAGRYDALEFRFLNLAAATRFSALEAFGAASDVPPELAAGIREDRAVIWKMGKGRGPLLTLKNAGEVMSAVAMKAWLPIQTGVADFMGDTKVWRPGRSLISAAQLHALAPRLEPGDLMLTRRDWYLSNVGLPGYWSHAAIYIGSARQRDAAFGEDAPHPGGSPPRLAGDAGAPVVIEAVGEGVVFTSLPHAGASDALVVLRPRLSPTAKARALARAFAFAGRPYDFNFDFRTDREIVCTELVYKAFQPGDGMPGLQLPLVSLVGRPALPANEIARLFAAELGTPGSQFEFVAFLDGRERTGDAVEASRAAFAESWKRPNWHIVTRAVEAALAAPRGSGRPNDPSSGAAPGPAARREVAP